MHRNHALARSHLQDAAITGKTFMNAPWLVAEAYKYRRLRECFAVSKYWKEYDVFFRQKVRIRGVIDDRPFPSRDQRGWGRSLIGISLRSAV
jgi:hypothetical protein